MVTPYDLMRWRAMASRAHRHELATPVVRLCDEVQLLRMQLADAQARLARHLHQSPVDLHQPATDLHQLDALGRRALEVHIVPHLPVAAPRPASGSPDGDKGGASLSP